MNILFHKNLYTSMGAIELLTSSNACHHFPRHFHETFPLGVVTEGALGFHYRGEKVTALRGTINLANPGEVHDGFPISNNGWQYRMFYIELNLIQEVMNQQHKQQSFPWFSNGVIRDQKLAGRISHLHNSIQNGILSQLAIETKLFQMLEQLIDQHAQIRTQWQSISSDHYKLQHVADYIRESCRFTLNLKDLALMSSYSVGYFIRAFQAYSGLTPHKYQLVCRMERARAQVLRKIPISQVAYENGFVDQSHFYKVFKQIYGYTPGMLQSS
ncbi:MAG: AraC family transcriptional regulator [Anaerolineaceae bacterium]|nr:AraC family transcriptional regulator [Anaerolineaceae bacterium]